MDFTSIFLVMVKLFLIMLVGFGCQKLGLFPEGTRAALTKVVVFLANPCIILSSVLENDDLPAAGTIGLLLLLSTACYAVMIGLAWLFVRLLRIRPGKRGAYLCMMVFSNCGFIGFPVVEAIFGRGAIFYAAVINIPFYPFLYCLGVWLLLRDRAALRGEAGRSGVRWTDMVNPCVVASVLSILIALTGFRLPAVLTDTISTLGSLTTPLALLCIGIMIAGLPLREMLGSPAIWAVTLARLGVIPVVLWLGLRLVLHDPVLIGTMVALMAMPIANMVPLLNAEYGTETTDPVRAVFLSTVASMVTIPILITLLA